MSLNSYFLMDFLISLRDEKHLQKQFFWWGFWGILRDDFEESSSGLKSSSSTLNQLWSSSPILISTKPFIFYASLPTQHNNQIIFIAKSIIESFSFLLKIFSFSLSLSHKTNNRTKLKGHKFINDNSNSKTFHIIFLQADIVAFSAAEIM